MDRYTGGAAKVAAAVVFFVFSSVGAQAQGIAGATAAQASASQTGAFQYRIPLSVPPGIGGVTPKLELSYSSQSSGSLLGKGWNLGGLSSISRCPRTKASDGVMGGVNFDANDRFCLDGQRLIVLSGTYGAANSEYRTERESFSQITFDGAAFTVKTKDGLTQQYGGTADSAIEAQGKTAIRTWALNKLSDRLGNYLTVSYVKDAVNGDYRPTRIDYTATASRAAGSAVVFDYADRTDITPRYLAGSVVKTMKRLTKVSTFTADAQVKEYRLQYATQAKPQEPSQIASIVECDTAGQCLPAHTVQWGAAGTNSFASPVNKLSAFGSSAGGWTDSVTYPRVVADVSGDGLADVVGFAADGVYVALNTGTAYGSSTKWVSGFGTSAGWANNNDTPRQLTDVNGDGLPDVVGFGTDGVWVSLNTGSSTFAAPVKWLAAFGSSAGGWTNNSVMPRYLVDIDGDGLPDVVGFNASGVSVALNSGASFSAPTYWLNGQFGTAQGWADNEVMPRQLVDINGDGLPDVVGFGHGGAYAAINTGSAFVLPSYSCSSGSVVSGAGCLRIYSATPTMGCPSGYTYGIFDPFVPLCYLGRYPNEYGWIQPIVVAYSCPSGGSLNGSTCSLTTTAQASFTCPSAYVASGQSCVPASGGQSITWQIADFGVDQGWTNSKTAPRYLVDVNGDGLPDIVGFSATGVKVALNTGAGFAPSTQWIADFGTSAGGWTNYDTYPRKLVDVNGDGLPDIVGFASAGVMVALNTGTSFDPAVNWVAAFGTTAGGWSSNTTMPREVLDVDGDGMPDVVGFAPGGVTVASNSRKAQASFVSAINNGLGLVYTPNFAALTSPAIAGLYTKDSGPAKATFPGQDLAGPWYVLASLDTSDGLGGAKTVNYTYGGLKAELGTGRGMLGFRWMSSKDATTLLEKYTEFRQDWPYTGMVAKAETRLSGAGNGGVLQRTSATVACKIPLNGTACVIQSRCDQIANASACATAASSRYFPYADSVLEERWDINGTSYPTTTTSTSYGVDSVNGQLYGDVSSSKVSTSDGASRTTAYTYEPADVTSWMLGRITSATTTFVKP